MFEVVYSPLDPLWVPVDYEGGVGGRTVRSGAIVSAGKLTPAAQGVEAMPVAVGASNTTNKDIPFGIVLADNNRTPTFDSTGRYIASVASQADQIAREFIGVEGPYPKSDPQAMVQITRITPETVIKGPICAGAIGTPPSETTVTTGSLTGLGFTSGAADFTPVAYNAVHFCRSGANRGLMRIGYDTSATVHTNYIAFPNDIAIGDTFVSVPLAPFGTCRAYIDSEGLYIDASAALTTNYLLIDVIRIGLDEAGKEYCVFRFNADNFTGARA